MHPNPGSEFRRLGMTFERVCSEALFLIPGGAHQGEEVVQEMSSDDPVADPGRLAVSCLWCVLISIETDQVEDHKDPGVA